MFKISKIMQISASIEKSTISYVIYVDLKKSKDPKYCIIKEYPKQGIIYQIIDII